MCGIVGGVGIKVTNETLDSIIHRGPDNQAIYNWKNISLGHVRLSIVDLSSAGNQPMQTDNERYTIIFNGEVYNHSDMRKEMSGISFKGHSDTETILYYFQKKGIDAVKRFNGIFSIALLDKIENKLYLIRDPFGVKPLYYYKKDNKIISFSSEIRPLFQLGAPKIFNEKLLNTFLKLRYVPAPNTLFKYIYKLNPGTILEIDLSNQEVVSEKYYHDIPVIDKEIQKEEALEQYDFLLKKAVKRQLMSDVPISLLLSGGVDSALLAKLVVEHSQSKLQTYTAGYEIRDNNINELEDADKTANILGIENRKIILKENEFIDILPELVEKIEEPLGSQSVFPIHFLSKKINQDGYKVVLTGQGVDEPWGGYLRYNPQEVFETLSKLPIPFLNILRKTQKKDSFRRALNTIAEKSRSLRFTESYSLFDNDMLKSILKSDFYDFNEQNLTPQLIQDKFIKYNLSNKSAVEAMMSLDSRMNLSDDLLLYTDKISMQYSLEMRVPFLDIELMNFAESLPYSLKVGLFKNKWLHKKLSEKHLPNEIIYRKKRGFYVPAKRWLQGDVGKIFEEMILNSENMKKYFEVNFISNLFTQHRLGRVNYEKQLYLLTVLCLWMDYNFKS